jgi:hypothetical protein
MFFLFIIMMFFVLISSYYKWSIVYNYFPIFLNFLLKTVDRYFNVFFFSC